VLKKMLKKACPILLFSLLSGLVLIQCYHTDSYRENGLKIAAVQLNITLELYESEEIFYHKIQKIYKQIMKNGTIDLIIFPEYTCSFLALIPYYEIIHTSEDYVECLVKIQNENPSFNGINSLFLSRADTVLQIIQNTFGTLSLKYRVATIAGTYFAQNSRLINVLHNRALVFNRQGEIIYYQDKVFLTDFEYQILHLTPGNIQLAKGFCLDGYYICLTICRDTFFEIWETLYNHFDLWVDIKANGTAFTLQEAESFQRALPERLKRTDIPYGLTICLTGHYLDLFWEGQSSLVKKTIDGLSTICQSGTYTEQEILFFSIH
jgi:predicted amidohydrolase